MNWFSLGEGYVAVAAVVPVDDNVMFSVSLGSLPDEGCCIELRRYSPTQETLMKQFPADGDDDDIKAAFEDAKNYAEEWVQGNF